MKNKLHNPHDKYFKDSFTKMEVARSFISEYLPEEIVSKMDLLSLEIKKDSYIDKRLSEHFSDILYSVDIAQKPTYIYLLFEHKSYVEEEISWQLLRLTVKILEHHRKQVKKGRFPAVLSTVYYHGKEKWNVEKSFSCLFDADETLKRYIPEFDYEVLDISHVSDDQIRGFELLKFVMNIQRFIFSEDFVKKLKETIEYLRIFDENYRDESLESLLVYLSSVLSDEQKEEISEIADEALNKGDDPMVMLGEKLIAKGRLEGKLEGKLEGVEELIPNMYKNGIKIEEIRKITGLSIERINELLKKADLV